MKWYPKTTGWKSGGGYHLTAPPVTLIMKEDNGGTMKRKELRMSAFTLA